MAESDFMALDANQDGHLSPSELHCALSDLGFSEGDILALIVKLGVNNNNDGYSRIAKHEFVANYGVYWEFMATRCRQVPYTHGDKSVPRLSDLWVGGGGS